MQCNTIITEIKVKEAIHVRCMTAKIHTFLVHFLHFFLSINLSILLFTGSLMNLQSRCV